MARGGRTALRLTALALFGVVIALGYGGIRYVTPGPLAHVKTVVVPRGATVADIGRQLKQANVISSEFFFELATRLTGAQSTLKAGEYQFASHVSMQQVVVKMQSGEVVIRRLTIPEGVTSAQAVELLRDTPGLEGDVGVIPEEGALLPETYTYSWGEQRKDLLRRMTAAMAATLRELWDNRAPNLPLSLPTEAVVLASIVERETALPAERPRVAAVFLNRLRLGMKLQADPTVTYAVGGGQPIARPLTLADLQRPSPYNTYLVDGLPPGPIANPGRASLRAVLQPASSEELYFVADGSGGHAFARTLEEHQRNVARWRKRNAE